MSKSKVHIIDLDEMETHDLAIEEAREFMTKSFLNGKTIIDKKTGVVLNIIPDVIEEVIIVGMIEGG